ncbi:hybrid sensor histidine kinase/response regulator [Shewanella sp. VB17]|uniref:hybrid sensor histidine kinase/response regulator n=1 Tax=Shewanella sp. VB17 TaxID=2739432 RepID=UPI00156347C4|nr:hybrid sensor histidine kinase/response regulator [Shewanella sp. VB17]NRD73975.1 hybrid sensor histidine kinase/response regulator [Shewanella sp. VB17]
MKLWLCQMKCKPYSFVCLVIGLAVTLFIDGLFWSHSQKEFSRHHEKKSAAAVIAAHDMLQQHRTIIKAIDSFFSASILVTKAEFTEFTHELLKIESAVAFTVDDDNKLAFISDPSFESEMELGKFSTNVDGELIFEMPEYSAFIIPIDEPDLRYMVYVISHQRVLNKLNNELEICIKYSIGDKTLSNGYCQIEKSSLQQLFFYYQSEDYHYESEFNAENYSLKTWYSPSGEEISEVLLIILLFSITGIGFSFLLYLKVEQKNALYKMRIETNSKVAVLSAINHEIRTPINAVLGYSKMLKDSGHFAQQDEMTVNKIIWSANLLNSVAENTLNFSKASADKLTLDNQETDLCELIHNIQDYYLAFSETHDKALNIIIKDPLPERVSLDSTKLYQLTTNIINNAFKYSTGKQVNCHIDLKYYYNRPFLRVAIRDFGKGMSISSIEAITRPFATDLHNTQVLQSGIGIGLYTCKQVIEKVGGKIMIRSKTGEGTLVIIRFPLGHVEQVAQADEQPVLTEGIMDNKVNDQQILAHLNIPENLQDIEIKKENMNKYQLKELLLVDDNLFNLEVCKAMLEKYGFNVTTQSDAISAKQYLIEMTPEIVLMDYRLEDTNGLALIDELMDLQICQEREKDIKKTYYFILSANDKAEIPFHEEYPDVFFMQKPLNMDIFIQQLDSLYTVN